MVLHLEEFYFFFYRPCDVSSKQNQSEIITMALDLLWILTLGAILFFILLVQFFFSTVWIIIFDLFNLFFMGNVKLVVFLFSVCVEYMERVAVDE